MSNPIALVARALAERSVRYVLIGVSGANLYAPKDQSMFVTEDYDLFLPLDADNLIEAWAVCDATGMNLWLGDEPLDRPRDRWLAEKMIERRALTRASGADGVQFDLTLVMAGFEFDAVWRERSIFVIEGAEVPTARLRHIVESKLAAGRPKDQLFLAAHKDVLEQLLKNPDLD